MTVAGAGVLGLVVALRLADAGMRVTVCDPAPLGANASGVAAGMLAPVFESVLDPTAADKRGESFALLLQARNLWPALVGRLGIAKALDRSGAVLAEVPGEQPSLAAAEQRMQSLGVVPHRLTAAALRALHPGLGGAVTGGLLSQEDWRLEPGLVLRTLAAALVDRGGGIVEAPLDLDAEQTPEPLVIAAGVHAGDFASQIPELGRLSPIKGQILQFEAGPLSGPVVRSLNGYIAPQPGGAVVGATMELGLRDLALDPGLLEDLRRAAATVFPHLATAPARGRAGVRAATPDGLPLVGRALGGSRQVVLCTGARRNGWLLAPLAAEVVLAALAGGDGGAAARAFDPGRFG